MRSCAGVWLRLLGKKKSAFTVSCRSSTDDADANVFAQMKPSMCGHWVKESRVVFLLLHCTHSFLACVNKSYERQNLTVVYEEFGV